MANYPTDPDVEADRRVERAKASLRAQVAVLERRLGEVRDRIDLPEQIRRHPLPAVSIAFALGALVGGLAGGRGSGLVGGRARRRAGRAATQAAQVLAGKPRTLGNMTLALASALGFQLLRELAIGQLKRTVERWWSERDERAPAHDLAPHEP